MMKARPRVLIVDDDACIRDALTDLLGVEGYDTDVVTNGAEAIEFLDGPRGAHLPNAMVVDLLMPGVVGQKLLEYLRHDTHLALIPIAVFSASPDLAPAGYRVFRKPLDLRPLLEFLRTGIESSKATDSQRKGANP